MIRFYIEENKVKFKGFLSELEYDLMSVSFGFLDFDNFDFEFYDIEKLCNFLEILDDRLF